jgi:1-acyl-sn-glycerol-3-phosphate acyltransferase
LIFNVIAVSAKIYFWLSGSRIIGGYQPQSNTIFAVNHRSPLDPFLVGAALQWPYCLNWRHLNQLCWYLAAADVIAGRAKSALAKLLRCLPVNRQNGKTVNGKINLEEVAKVITTSTLMVFPEGKCGVLPQEALQPAQGGLGLLAQLTGCQVIPVAISGSGELKGPKLRPQWGPVTIVIGQPMNFSLAKREKFDKQLALAITAEVMAEIAALQQQARKLR